MDKANENANFDEVLDSDPIFGRADRDLIEGEIENDILKKKFRSLTELNDFESDEEGRTP